MQTELERAGPPTFVRRRKCHAFCDPYALALEGVAVVAQRIDEVRRHAGAGAGGLSPDTDVVLAAGLLAVAGAQLRRENEASHAVRVLRAGAQAVLVTVHVQEVSARAVREQLAART